MRTTVISTRVPIRGATAFLVAALTVAALTGTLAEAHTGTGPIGGFESGFTHPIFGFDHLLAMLAVGIWGAQMGGRSVWTLPATFPVIMAFGGLLGMSGFSLPHVELGIALSVLVLGGAIAVGWKPPEWVALGLIAIFAICHGYAHGVELPSAADPGSYAAGFVMATGTIHVAGIGIGLLLLRVGGQWLAQGLGALMSCTGLYFATPLVS